MADFKTTTEPFFLASVPSVHLATDSAVPITVRIVFSLVTSVVAAAAVVDGSPTTSGSSCCCSVVWLITAAVGCTADQSDRRRRRHNNCQPLGDSSTHYFRCTRRGSTVAAAGFPSPLAADELSSH